MDDCLLIEKVFSKDEIRTNANGKVTALTCARQTQSHFWMVEYNSSMHRIIINNNKTKMITISTARSYHSESYILTTTGTRISSEDTLKVLGFTFSKRPDVSEHIKITLRKFKCRIWALRHLKRNGLKKNDLTLVYKTMIRPLAEYCSSVFFLYANNI